MGRRLIYLVLVLPLLAAVLVGCAADPKEQYAVNVSGIIHEWGLIIGEWNASPGDAGVATKFASLQARANAIKPPEEMANLHALLMQAMEAEAKSFEVYALGKKEYSESLHDIALDSMEKYNEALQKLGLIK